jgi:hypothetical protein
MAKPSSYITRSYITQPYTNSMLVNMFQADFWRRAFLHVSWFKGTVQRKLRGVKSGING